MLPPRSGSSRQFQSEGKATNPADSRPGRYIPGPDRPPHDRPRLVGKRVVAQVEVDRVNQPVLFRQLHQLAQLSQIHRERFFANNVLAGEHAAFAWAKCRWFGDVICTTLIVGSASISSAEP